MEAAFASVLAARRAKRQKASDVHVAHAVLSDSTLRRAYDLSMVGTATAEKLNGAFEAVAEAIPEIEWTEVRENATKAVLQATVLVAGFTAKVSDTAGLVSRKVQSAAWERLGRS